VENWKTYYSAQSPVTDPEEYQSRYENLPDDIPLLCAILQGLILHLYWTQAYGVEISEARKEEVKIRKTTRQIAHLLDLADLPLTAARTPDKRIIGTCRDYSAFLTSILRSRGIPARVRAGYADYLKPDRWENHYLCQYWSEPQQRWITVDAQLDKLQRQAMKINFDPCDVPEDRYWTTGKAWQMCRQGKMVPELFGIGEFRGLWFTGGEVVHDILALNKIELQPWDIWRLMPRYQQKTITPEHLDLLDRMAALSANMNPDFDEVRAFYQAEKKLQPAKSWRP
jgi:hypothetical protein